MSNLLICWTARADVLPIHNCPNFWVSGWEIGKLGIMILLETKICVLVRQFRRCDGVYQ